MDSPSPFQVPPATPLSGQETKGTDGPGNVSDEEGFLSGEEEFQVAPESLVAPVSDGEKVQDEDTDGEKVIEEDVVGDSNGQSNGFHDLDASSGSVVVGDTGHAAFDTSQSKGDNGGGIEGAGDSKALLADDGDKLEENGERLDEVDLVNKGPSYAEVVQLSGDATLDSKEQKEGAGEVGEDAGRVPEVAEVKTNDVAVAESNNTDDKNKDESSFVEPDVVEVDGVKVTPEGDSILDAIDADVKVPGIAVVGKAENVEPAIVERELPVEVPVVATGNTDETNQEELKSVEPDVVEVPANVEPAKVERELPVDVPVVATGNTDETSQEELKSVEPDVVEVDGIKLTPEGDSIVDAIDADVKVPGIAVVGKADVPKVEEEIPVDVSVVATDNTDEGSQKDLKRVDSDVVEIDGVQLTTEGDSVVDAINADVKTPGIAVVGESPESEPAKMEEELPVDDPSTLNSVSAAAEPASNEELNMKGDDGGSSIVHDTEMMDTKNIEETPEVEKEELEASESIETEASKKFENGNELGRNENLGDRVTVAARDGNVDSDVFVQGGDSDEPQLPDTVDAAAEDSDGENDGLIFGSSEAAKQFIEQLEQGSGSDMSHHHLQGMDGQVVTDSDEEVDTDDEGEAKELLDPSALAALLKAATGADADGDGGGGITITSQDGTRLFSVERPAGLGSSLRALRPNPRQTPLNLFAPSTTTDTVDSEATLSDEEKKTFEKLQQIRVKYLRLIHRLGLSPDDSVPAQVLYRMMLIMGRQGGRVYTMDAAKTLALQLEAEEGNDLDLSVNILVLGKCGVGKSATINSIFGEEKARIDAFQPATEGVREIVGYVNGVKLRVFDTPGLKCSVYEQSFNRSILSSVKRATKRHPLDIVLYVDRMDSQTRDMNDVPLIKTISSSLGSSIWKMSIITLTHAASAPPDGPSGSPLSYDVFATQRSHVLQQTVSSAAGEVRMMNPSLMHPVALVENHPSCRKNREGQKVLPNGQSWRPQLLLLCFSLKILSEVNSISKPQDAFDHRKIFGFRGRAPPLPYMLSSMLQSRPHPKLPSEQGGDNGDSDIDLDYFSDPDQDEEDEYEQLPPFTPLKKSQVAKLSKEQRRAYFEEYDYRVKLLQKKQLKDELKRMKEMKNRGKDVTVDYADMEEDADSGAAAPVAVPLPDMVLPPSFDSDNPAYRYRFLEPTSQFLARPVLDTHGWDHDCGYDGVNVEQGLAIVNRYPAAVTFQITKDKKDFTISLDSSVSAKHGENGSSMAGFDIQSLGKQLAYTLRGETKFKILKRNKTSGGISVTFLGDNIVSGAKLEDQITIGKQYVLVGSAGAVRSDRDTAYGANFELQRREADFPIGQAQSTFSMSLIKWRGDLALGFNTLFQFSVGRGSKVAIRAGLNNKLSGQITVKTSSSDHLSLALTALIPIAASIYKKLQPGAPEQYALY